MRTYFERICLIVSVLETLGIPYSTNKIFDGWQIRFPWCNGDVCCHYGTYGAEDGMVKSFRFPWDNDDVSVLTPEKAATLIVSLYSAISA